MFLRTGSNIRPSASNPPMGEASSGKREGDWDRVLREGDGDLVLRGGGPLGEVEGEVDLDLALDQGLTLVHFSAELEHFL